MRTIPGRFIAISYIQNLFENINRLINLRFSRRKRNRWTLAHAPSEAQSFPQIGVLQVAVCQVYCSFNYCDMLFFEELGMSLFQFSNFFLLSDQIFAVVEFITLNLLMGEIETLQTRFYGSEF